MRKRQRKEFSVRWFQGQYGLSYRKSMLLCQWIRRSKQSSFNFELFDSLLRKYSGRDTPEKLLSAITEDYDTFSKREAKENSDTTKSEEFQETNSTHYSQPKKVKSSSSLKFPDQNDVSSERESYCTEEDTNVVLSFILKYSASFIC